MPKLHAVPTARELITIKDFYRLVPDGQKADLIDGVIYMASPDSTENNRINNFRNCSGGDSAGRVAYGYSICARSGLS